MRLIGVELTATSAVAASRKQVEFLAVAWSDGGEVASVECHDGRSRESLGKGDHRGVGPTERKVCVLSDELRHPHEVLDARAFDVQLVEPMYRGRRQLPRARASHSVQSRSSMSRAVVLLPLWPRAANSSARGWPSTSPKWTANAPRTISETDSSRRRASRARTPAKSSGSDWCASYAHTSIGVVCVGSSGGATRHRPSAP